MSDFRKIDVDALIPDNILTKEDLIPDLPPVSEQDISSRAQLVRQTLQKGDFAGALQVALDNPPYGGTDSLKEVHLKTVVDILTSVKSNDITGVVQSLSAEQQNVLVKYLYKAMGSPIGQAHGNGGIMLSWFERTTAVTGQGPIVRFLSDRRTV
ncbi:actin-related protein 2/3 complex subunit 5 [Trichomonascus vanleenenianus]|uniref:Arc15p n=1 Tax=Trichomonascus vanleenenianus TaxID=2268995 RepID=UPI003ECA8B97